MVLSIVLSSAHGCTRRGCAEIRVNTDNGSEISSRSCCTAIDRGESDKYVVLQYKKNSRDRGQYSVLCVSRTVLMWVVPCCFSHAFSCTVPVSGGALLLNIQGLDDVMVYRENPGPRDINPPAPLPSTLTVCSTLLTAPQVHHPVRFACTWCTVCFALHYAPGTPASESVEYMVYCLLHNTHCAPGTPASESAYCEVRPQQHSQKRLLFKTGRKAEDRMLSLCSLVLCQYSAMQSSF